GIFGREILMAAGMQLVIRNFALHPHCAKFCLENAANLSGQLADGENLRRLLEEISGQLHGALRLILESARALACAPGDSSRVIGRTTRFAHLPAVSGPICDMHSLSRRGLAGCV